MRTIGLLAVILTLSGCGGGNCAWYNQLRVYVSTANPRVQKDGKEAMYFAACKMQSSAEKKKKERERGFRPPGKAR